MTDPRIEAMASAILDCEAAGPISGSAARVVAGNADEAYRAHPLTVAEQAVIEAAEWYADAWESGDLFCDNYAAIQLSERIAALQAEREKAE